MNLSELWPLTLLWLFRKRTEEAQNDVLGPSTIVEQGAPLLDAATAPDNEWWGAGELAAGPIVEALKTQFIPYGPSLMGGWDWGEVQERIGKYLSDTSITGERTVQGLWESQGLGSILYPIGTTMSYELDVLGTPLARIWDVPGGSTWTTDLGALLGGGSYFIPAYQDVYSPIR